MHKIRLDLDALDIDSFSVTAPVPTRGTLVAHEETEIGCTIIYTQNWGPCGTTSGLTYNCPLHTEQCTRGELCYSVMPNGYCDPTDYASCYDDCR